MNERRREEWFIIWCTAVEREYGFEEAVELVLVRANSKKEAIEKAKSVWDKEVWDVECEVLFSDTVEYDIEEMREFIEGEKDMVSLQSIQTA